MTHIFANVRLPLQYYLVILQFVNIFAKLYIILIFAANCLQKGGRDTGAGLTLSIQTVGSL
jgi:hypothetical protein